MNKFLAGSAMGLMVGAGLMMMPGAKKVQRSVLKETDRMKRWIRKM